MRNKTDIKVCFLAKMAWWFMESSFVTVNRVKLHVVTAGPEAGPLVVLLHGFPEHWPSYRHQIPILAKAGFRVVVPDQRGYNLSDKPRGRIAYDISELCDDIVKLIKQTGRNDAAIVGHDWGGVVAHRLAMDYPDMVRKLVIINSPHPAAMKRELKGSQLLRSWYFFYFLTPKLPETLFGLFPRASARLLMRGSAVVKDAHKDSDIEEVAQAISQQGTMTAMLNWYRAGLRAQQKPRIKKIMAKTMVLWGEKDPALGIRLTHGLEEWFGPSFTLIKLPNVGHWPQHEATEEVNRHLLDFLN